HLPAADGRGCDRVRGGAPVAGAAGEAGRGAGRGRVVASGAAVAGGARARRPPRSGSARGGRARHRRTERGAVAPPRPRVARWLTGGGRRAPGGRRGPRRTAFGAYGARGWLGGARRARGRRVVVRRGDTRAGWRSGSRLRRGAVVVRGGRSAGDRARRVRGAIRRRTGKGFLRHFRPPPSVCGGAGGRCRGRGGLTRPGRRRRARRTGWLRAEDIGAAGTVGERRARRHGARGVRAR